jgi:tRNA (cytidine/uridine-2'-O-)-methyltransferase
MRIVLYQPDIPQNTGTILRLAACLNFSVDIIGPTGFDMSDRSLRRAGMDYIDRVKLTRHISFEDFAANQGTDPRRIILMTTRGSQNYTDFKFGESDCILFGRESSGVPDKVMNTATAKLKIPMVSGLRSLNLAVSVAMVVGEALRQLDRFPNEEKA